MTEPGGVAECPACNDELRAWVTTPNPSGGADIPIERCDRCRLAAIGGTDPIEIGLELDRYILDEPDRADDSAAGRTRYLIPNRAGLAATIGGGAWSQLGTDGSRLGLTPMAARLLLERRGEVVCSLRWPIAAGNHRAIWQTLLNGFTLRLNFARSALAGTIHPMGRREVAAFAVDAIASALAALLLVPLGSLLELVAVLVRRGGLIAIETEPKTAIDPD